MIIHREWKEATKVGKWNKNNFLKIKIQHSFKWQKSWVPIRTPLRISVPNNGYNSENSERKAKSAYRLSLFLRQNYRPPLWSYSSSVKRQAKGELKSERWVLTFQPFGNQGRIVNIDPLESWVNLGLVDPLKGLECWKKRHAGEGREKRYYWRVVWGKKTDRVCDAEGGGGTRGDARN